MTKLNNEETIEKVTGGTDKMADLKKSLADMIGEDVMKKLENVYSDVEVCKILAENGIDLEKVEKRIADAGAFPRDYGFVRALPGVGDYTAAAIMSFAFGEPYAVLDGNVQRVLSRYFGISEPVDSAQGKKLLRALADEMLDRQHPSLYNQAIMDFGALHCKPTSPLCDTCPLADTCQALREHLVDKLPVKAKRTAVRDRYLTYIYVRTQDGLTLLHRRGSGDIWQGLFEFPLIESDKPLSAKEVELKINTTLHSSLFTLHSIAYGIRHQLTHQRLHADFYLLILPQVNNEMVIGKAPLNPFRKEETDSSEPKLSEEWPMADGQWIKESDLDRYAMPRLLEKLLERMKGE